MGTKIVSLRVNQEKEVISLKRVMGVGDKPIKIQAQPKAKYQFADSETGKGPEHIITKRVGDDLYISFDFYYKASMRLPVPPNTKLGFSN